MYEVKVEFHKDFIKVEGNRILVGLSSKPDKGKANAELIKKIAAHFNISSLQVKIVSGFKSRRKIVELIP
jgi:uncharacterized protein (TIGR00251 family)